MTCNVSIMYLYVLVHLTFVCVAILKSHHLYTGVYPSSTFVFLILTLLVFLCCAVSTYSHCVVFFVIATEEDLRREVETFGR